MNQSIDDAMAYPWTPVIEPDTDGGFRLTVFPRLADFEIFADTRADLESDWRDALYSHLQAYIASGKCVPIPSVRMQHQEPDQSTRGSGHPLLVKIEDGKLQAA